MSWADRALIALLLNVIPKRHRAGLRLIVTPQTVLRWHRDSVARRWAAKSRHKRPGRPRAHRSIGASVLRLAKGEPRLGLPTRPRRTRRPRHRHGALDGVGDPHQGRAATCPQAHGTNMGPVPARSG